jgi:hypothetical protein
VSRLLQTARAENKFDSDWVSRPHALLLSGAGRLRLSPLPSRQQRLTGVVSRGRAL